MSNRTIIIGDVHGMKKALVSLIGEVKPTSSDSVVFVGDLVDKGPESAQVVAYVRELSKTLDITVVEGNHEEKHTRFRKSRNMEMKGSDELKTITDALSVEDVAFMESFVPFHRVEEHGVLVVHAGITGDLQSFPTLGEYAELSKKKKKSFSKIMRTRHVDAETGKFIQLGDAKPCDPFWADVYDGRFGHVVFGHEPMMDGVKSFDHATGIDTGAVFGGQLTALVLEGGSRKVVSVQCEKYAEPMAC